MGVTTRTWALVLMLGWPLAAVGGDGRIEINQSCAVETGCGPGDPPGFPVVLQATGSYVLTSDLVPGPDHSAIEIRQNSIDLDLNGFSLRGPALIGGPVSGIVSFNLFAFNSRIHNGAVRGFRGKGIDLIQIDGVRIEDLLVYDNSEGGIALGNHGLVTDSRIRDNGNFGMSLGATTAYEDCIVTGTQPGFAVSGGVQIGGSYCDDHTCSPYPPMRRYYLTRGSFAANQVNNACDDGFHFASVYELHDPALLRYDTSRGFLLADSGQGPPSSPDSTVGDPSRAWGWARSGGVPEVSSGEAVNCAAWTSTSSAHLGRQLGLFQQGRYVPPGGVEFPLSPWDTSSRNCGFSTPVWCVED